MVEDVFHAAVSVSFALASIPTAVPDRPSGTQFILASELIVRAKPDRSGGYLGRYPIDTPVEVKGVSGEWLDIEVGRCSPIRGWVPSKFVGPRENLVAMLDEAATRKDETGQIVALERLVAREPLSRTYRAQLARLYRGQNQERAAAEMEAALKQGRLADIRFVVPDRYNEASGVFDDDQWFGVYELGGRLLIEAVCVKETKLEGEEELGGWEISAQAAAPERKGVASRYIFLVRGAALAAGRAYLHARQPSVHSMLVGPAPSRVNFAYGGSKWTVALSEGTPAAPGELQILREGRTVLRRKVPEDLNTGHVVWFDLDGDEKLDFFLDVTGYQDTAEVELYLSSQAVGARPFSKAATFVRLQGC